MKPDGLSFLVLGAGAIGGITAAYLKKHGYDVEIVCKYDDYAKLISEKGINVTTLTGRFNVKIPAYSSVSQVRGRKDIILHATKASDMIDAAVEAQSLLSEDGYFVSMQNGICEEALAKAVGSHRVIGCVTGWGATMGARGNLEMTSTGDFILGYPYREPDSFLVSVAEALSCIVPVKTTSNIIGHLYSKLIINACITSLGALCGLFLGDMLSIKKVRRIFIEIIREAVAVAEKKEINIEIFGGKLDFRTFVKGDSYFHEMKRHLLIRIIGFKYRRLKSSSLQSLERGKPTEVDYFNGYILLKGIEAGVDVPVNKAIVRMIHEIERGDRKISIDNFDEPVFDRFR